MKRLLVFLLVFLLLLPACSTPVSPPAQQVTLEQRLDRLVEQLEQQREAFHIPGMAISIVKDDEIILARGFGVENMETQTPVTPETVFAIGSSTKAFTSALVGMMVDEGKMEWDAPITDYLPYFELEVKSDYESAQITVRDLLSHRTGYTRMGLLFASGEIPREEILQAATAAEPFSGFREKFYYSNVMYMAAGVAAGKVAGSDWDTLVAKRILEPLGMNITSTSINEAQQNPHLSLGYLWDENMQEYEYKPMRNIDNIAPAGAINSNVLDMAQWLRLQLGRGEYEGERLISETALGKTWTSQIEIAPGIGYGMGWMLREWEGQPVIEHGGNIDGFSAEVAMLPESSIGFVLLTNASVSRLQQTSVNMVWEALLGEWREAGATDGEEDFGPYLGAYTANFGSFKDTEFTVLVQNGRLAVDVPGQQVYELKNPDTEGKWYFSISNEIAVSFERDDEGNVISMKMYQSGLTFELPRKGVEMAPEIPLEELHRYLGSYRSEELDVTAKVLIQNNRLAIDWPGEMVYELYLPDQTGLWVFLISERFVLRFNETPGGKIESLTYYQDDKEFLMPLTEEEILPTVAEVLALRDTDGRKTALEMMGNYKVTGTIHSVQSGVWADLNIYVSGIDKYRVDVDYGRFGYSRTAVNGNQAWTESSFGPFDEIHGKFLEQMKRSHPESMIGDWRDFFDSIQILHSDSLDGQKVYVLNLTRGELPPVTVYVNAVTGDVLRSTTTVIQEGEIAIPVTTRYEDYREIHGVRVPLQETSTNEQSGQAIAHYKTTEVNIDVADEFFILTPPTSQ